MGEDKEGADIDETKEEEKEDNAGPLILPLFSLAVV